MINQPNTQLQKRNAEELPSALAEFDMILASKKPAVFLDYDGCLTPIVKEPDMAILSPQTREVLRDLANVCPVAIVSGRDRQNVQKLVQLDNLYFAGSHGFDISGPDKLHTEPGGAAAALPALDNAELALKNKLQAIAGTLVERKRYAIAVHYRNVADAQVNEVETIVDTVLSDHPQLKKGLGKKVFELKPNLDWHKGKAVFWLLDELHLNKPDIVPIYIGDDITDEDAFAALQGIGVGILVGAHDEKSAAGYSLKGVAEVQIFLQKLTETIKQRHA
ncbi:trehalose-phosphatase [Pontibacter fetidus]|uniref:Trehalose 6-phosphate phosphatase n=1 Tax=Pontibacter fetidus TaxID=2700082 RepID=A0A6B2GWE1_9BACT|nr:trehalose-phosphatase [Pontibacter fetidus]NDK54301.1 trehalose-phosphatase [Pontibacter fetidus]